MAHRLSAVSARIAVRRAGAGVPSACAHSLTYSDTKPKKSLEGATEAAMRWKSSHALPVSSAFSLRRVARSAESTSSSRSSGRLIVSRTSLCTVAASSAGGTEGSVTRRKMAGLILTDLATASVLSLRSDVGMGVALCASMCSTVRGPSVPPGVFGLARMKDIMPPPEPLFTALLNASTLNLSSRWAMESNALSPG